MGPSLQKVRRSLSGPTFRKKVFPWLLILPILLLHLVVVIGPSMAAFYYSLTEWSGIGPATFVGLDNFRRLFFEDMLFRRAFTNNLMWLAFFLTVPFILALTVASLLAGVRRGAMLYRSTIFLPYVLPSVITATIWSNLLNPRLGIGAQLAKLGVEGVNRAFLGNPDTVLVSIAFIDNWHFWGFLMVLFLAAMQAISRDLYDAAKIDGANRWQEFLNVTIPGILPTVIFMYMMVAVWSFLVFDYVWLLTQGGPAGASQVLGTLLYRDAFNRFEAGYASAIGLTMSFFAILVIGIFGLLRRRGWEI